MKVVQTMISLCDWVESIVGKGENAGYQHFLLFPQCFKKSCLSGSLNLGLCGKEFNGSEIDQLFKHRYITNIWYVRDTKAPGI